MHYRNLGASGLKISAVGLGTNRFGGKVDQAGVQAILDTAIDQGVNFIDTADIYQDGRSEETIGRALLGRRHSMVIATKVFHPMGSGPNDRGASRQHILSAIEASLRRLQTDYIDLYQIHRWDAAAPIEETLRTLEDLLRSGKARYIGASNFDAWQLVHANGLAGRHGWTSLVSIQPHYHMLAREIEKELLPACRYFNIGVLPYFPLAGGFLTGKYKRDEAPPPGSRGVDNAYVQKFMTPENYTRLDKLTLFASENNHNLTDLAHAWLLAQPQVASVISGATRPEHVQANVAGADWQLKPDELSQVNAILESD